MKTHIVIEWMIGIKIYSVIKKFLMIPDISISTVTVAIVNSLITKTLMKWDIALNKELITKVYISKRKKQLLVLCPKQYFVNMK